VEHRGASVLRGVLLLEAFDELADGGGHDVQQEVLMQAVRERHEGLRVRAFLVQPLPHPIGYRLIGIAVHDQEGSGHVGDLAEGVEAREWQLGHDGEQRAEPGHPVDNEVFHGSEWRS